MTRHFLNSRTDEIHSVVMSDDVIVTPSVLTPGSIHMVENRPTSIHCAAFGGYPPPSLELYIGSRDVTGEFRYSNSVTLEGEHAGLRHIVYRTDRRSDEFNGRWTDDETKLKCMATVNELKPYTISTQLIVDC